MPKSSSTEDDGGLLTLKQVAEILGVTERHLFNERAAGRLKVRKLSYKVIRVRREDLDAYIAAHVDRELDLDDEDGE